MKDKDKIILEEQEYNDNHYQFFGVPIVYTPAFREAFGEEHEVVIAVSLMKLEEKYPEKNYDALQVFSYKGVTYWCISDADQKEHWENEHITFLLPDDY